MVNNQTIFKLLFISSVLLLIPNTLCLQSSFTITKSYLVSRTSPINLGSLKIIEQADTNQAYIQSHDSLFVSADQVQKHETVILTFTNDKTHKQYRTAISNHYNKLPHYSEKIVVVLSSSEEVIGFNYVRVKEQGKDVAVQIQQPQKSVEHVFKVQTQQKQAAQQESFFSKYKWPLIIGGVLLYMTMNANPEKAEAPRQ